MNFKKLNHRIIIIIFLVFISSPLIAQYSISKSVMASGGALVGDDRITINSTIGQPVIGISTIDSDSCKLGFWYIHSKAVVGIQETYDLIPKMFKLDQNYPNPFNPITVISWQVGATGQSPTQVELSVYNLLGQRLATLVSKRQPAGYYSYKWDASGLASGVYYYRLVAGEYVDIKKLVVLK